MADGDQINSSCAYSGLLVLCLHWRNNEKEMNLAIMQGHVIERISNYFKRFPAHYMKTIKPHTLDAIRRRDADFQFSEVNKFNAAGKGILKAMDKMYYRYVKEKSELS